MTRKTYSDEFGRSRRVQMQAGPSKPPRLSVLAAALGLVAWAVPMLPIVPIGVGWRSVRQAGRARLWGGLGLSLGVLGLMLQGWVCFQGYGVYRTLRNGPVHTIAQGSSGNTEQFASAFASHHVDPDSAEHFFIELEGRYGRFVRATPMDSTWSAMPGVLRGDDVSTRYAVEFERGLVEVHAHLSGLNLGELARGGVPELNRLELLDPTHAQAPQHFPQSRVTGVDPAHVH